MFELQQTMSLDISLSVLIRKSTHARAHTHTQQLPFFSQHKYFHYLSEFLPLSNSQEDEDGAMQVAAKQEPGCSGGSISLVLPLPREMIGNLSTIKRKEKPRSVFIDPADVPQITYYIPSVI